MAATEYRVIYDAFGYGSTQDIERALRYCEKDVPGNEQVDIRVKEGRFLNSRAGKDTGFGTGLISFRDATGETSQEALEDYAKTVLLGLVALAHADEIHFDWTEA